MALVCHSASALGEPRAAKLKVGAVAGLNASMISSDGTDIWDRPRIGLVAGVRFAAHASHHLAGRVEVLYSQRGARGSTGGESIQFNSSYVEVPILAEYHFRSKLRFPARVFSGVVLAWNLSGRIESDDLLLQPQGPPGQQLYPLRVDLPMRDLDVGLVAGAGMDVKMLDRSMSLGLRYTHSLTDIYEANSGATTFVGARALPAEASSVANLLSVKRHKGLTFAIGSDF